MKNEKIVLVSGGNRGIGLEVCSQLAAMGHQVILSSRDPAKGRVAVELLSQHKGNLHFHPLDISKQQSVNAMREFIVNRFGRLDILVNNAGINYDTWHTAIRADLTESRQTLEVNLFGQWRMCQAFIPIMQDHHYGRVVNVSSGSGALSGMGGGTPAYSISKAALNVLTIKLAFETKGSGVLVNAVCPGWVRTEMGGNNAPRSVAQGAKGIVWAATLPEEGPNGGFFRDGKRIDW